MSTLQLSPIGGVPAPVAGTSPAGEAAATQKSTPNANSSSSAATAAAPAKPDSVSAQLAAQAKHATAAVDANAAQNAAVEDAKQVQRIETPTLNLSVGLIGGSFDVYVDLTDPTDNRVVARLYGPKGGTSEPHPAPSRVRTEA